MRVLVLGHRGMLGHVVVRTFAEAGLGVATIEQRFSSEASLEFVREVTRAEADWCVNCIGAGPGRGASPPIMWETNAELPRRTIRAWQGRAGYIHASSDGVFVPDKPERQASETPDAEDPYGRSKIAGEMAVIEAGGFVLRCSIVGPEAGTCRSLLQWLAAQQGEVRGYTNHAWNGITTRAWAKLALGLMTGEPRRPSILQPGFWPAVSKCDLLRAIAREWALPVTILEHAAPQPVARTLRPTILLPPIEEQLRELHAWYGPLDAKTAA